MAICPLKQPMSVGTVKTVIGTICDPECAWYVPDKGCAIAVIAAALSEQKR